MLEPRGIHHDGAVGIRDVWQGLALSGRNSAAEDPDPTVRCALAHASTIISPWGDAAMTAVAQKDSKVVKLKASNKMCGVGLRSGRGFNWSVAEALQVP